MTGEPFFWGMPKLADPHWDRLWAMTQEAGLSVNFHIGSGDMSIFERAYEGAGEHANYAGFGVQFGIGNVSVIANLITGGVCHRFPEQKFVSVESGVGWIPFALHHLDWQWQNCGVPQEHPEYELLPSEYFKRQMYGCFWFENDTVKAAIDQMGPGVLPVRERLPAPDEHGARSGDGRRGAPPVHRRGARRPTRGRPPGGPPRQRRTALPPRTDAVTSVPILVMNGDDTDTPPSTVRMAPVVKLEASEARYSTVPTISAAGPTAAADSAAWRGPRTPGRPTLGDVGEERADHDPVGPHGRAVRHGEAEVSALSPALAAA